MLAGNGAITDAWHENPACVWKDSKLTLTVENDYDPDGQPAQGRSMTRIPDQPKLLALSQSEEWVNGSMFSLPEAAGDLFVIAPVNMDLHEGLAIRVRLQAKGSLTFDTPAFQLIVPNAPPIVEAPKYILQKNKGAIDTAAIQAGSQRDETQLEQQFRLRGLLQNPSDKERTMFDLYLLPSVRFPSHFFLRLGFARCADVHFEFPDFGFKYHPGRNGHCLCDLPQAKNS